MFRSIQKSIGKRAENLKTKSAGQWALEKAIRSFLIQEFGPIGESLGFTASQENKKLRLRIENKTAANEIVLRSGKLGQALRDRKFGIEQIFID